MRGSAVRNVLKSRTGNPWLDVPIAENISKHKTSPPARRRPICLNHFKKKLVRREFQREKKKGPKLKFLERVYINYAQDINFEGSASCFSNRMTPSSGDPSSPTKTVLFSASLVQGGGAGVAVGPASSPPMRLVGRLRLGIGLGRDLEKREVFRFRTGEGE